VLRSACLLAIVAALSGCATVTGEPTQDVTIVTVDAKGMPVDGLRCVVANGSDEWVGNSPMHGLQVRRSATNLQIECRRGAQIAWGTAISRGGLRGTAALLMPGGTAMVAVDHLSGYRYSYPQLIKLRIGEHLVFDASDEVAGRPSRGITADAPR
jgi:hypothetical protein